MINLSSDNHLVDGPTDRPTDKPTDRQTDMSKAIYPLFFEGGHKNVKINVHLYNDSGIWSRIIRAASCENGSRPACIDAKSCQELYSVHYKVTQCFGTRLCICSEAGHLEQTNQPTNRPTDRAKTICPPLL
ncbi:hypothetical protein DPMN_049001 [Dreissena polymorpha]|uniref:Uncharacterized protein n=1 Tax=Dreissena polymorpha TaxID=45954 RepID=A0A9D4DCN3_DREPO|nr:hypothetical protein DPMN_049001 [Dreissena polymorpha]